MGLGATGGKLVPVAATRVMMQPENRLRWLLCKSIPLTTLLGTSLCAQFLRSVFTVSKANLLASCGLTVVHLQKGLGRLVRMMALSSCRGLSSRGVARTGGSSITLKNRFASIIPPLESTSWMMPAGFSSATALPKARPKVSISRPPATRLALSQT